MPFNFRCSVVGKVVSLAVDSSGYHVLESVLEHGSEDEQHSIALELLQAITRLSMHTTGHQVVRKALVCCSEHDQEEIANALCSPSNFSILAKNMYGRRVASTLLRLPDEISHQAVSQLNCVSLASPIPQHAKDVLFALRRHCGVNHN